MYGLDRIAKNVSFSRPDRIQIWRQNVRQSAIFHQILPKFELNQGLCNIYSMKTFKINVPKFEGDK